MRRSSFPVSGPVRNHISPQVERWIAVLGRQDHPTDALEDYCLQLAQALRQKEVELEIVRVAWNEAGWRRALQELETRAADRRGSWALVQYTALSWSRRGFPRRFPALIERLQRAGLRVLIVFHEPQPFGGERLIDQLRRRAQIAAMRRAARQADRIVSTLSPDRVTWMQDAAIRAKSIALPVGSNLPAAPRAAQPADRRAPVVAVFGCTENSSPEAELLAWVLRRAAAEAGPLHLVIFGRGAEDAGAELRGLLDGSGVELETHGILDPARAAAILAGADVQLFVRSGLTPSRGSAIAGIVAGLPLVGFSGEQTELPVGELGVRLVPRGDREGLARELARVLQDPALREELRRRNAIAGARYFSWERIAGAYLALIGTE